MGEQGFISYICCSVTESGKHSSGSVVTCFPVPGADLGRPGGADKLEVINSLPQPPDQAKTWAWSMRGHRKEEEQMSGGQETWVGAGFCHWPAVWLATVGSSMDSNWKALFLLDPLNNP